MTNRPHGRQKTTSSSHSTVEKRGSGFNAGHGSVGSGNHFSSSSHDSYSSRSNGSSYTRSAGGQGGLLRIIVIIVIVVFFGGGGALSGLFGGSSSSYDDTSYDTGTTSNGLSGYTSSTNYVDASTSSLNRSVSPQARNKFTSIVGEGKDTVTLMVYMCGADLESSYGMATSDLNEILYGHDSDNLHIVIETGGAKKWQNSVISNRTNQRYLVTDKGLQTLDSNVGNLAMTDPNTLEDFIQFSKKEYPADRYMLILWDHGGGSVTGYGYDELHQNEGSMSVDKISSAIKKANIKFDFIGFDACLMANLETAVALEPYADYLIASEETEPGTGWYYTNWISTLADNTSTETIDLGKEIIDDFIQVSAKNRSTDQTTLSLVDLSEFGGTVPSSLKTFASNVSTIVKSDDYQVVTTARSSSREFAPSNDLDQIDVVDFANKINTTESLDLSNAIQSCVKYNRSNNITNAYGMSMYFPYSSLNKMNSMVKIYDDISIDSDYSDCVKSFATLVSSGQIATSHNSGSASSLFDTLMGSYSSGSSSSSSDILGLLMNSFDSSSSSSSGIDFSSLLGADSSSWLDSNSLSTFANLIGKSQITTDDLQLTQVNGQQVVSLSEDQWSNIHNIALNVFVDDGEGLIDLGLDNVFTFDDAGNLIVNYDATWISLNEHVVAYYVTSDDYSDDGTYKTQGRIPAYVNGQLVDILVQFTNEHPEGEILGTRIMYEDETSTLAKGLTDLSIGDKIEPICDYYSYNGEFINNYYLGDAFTLEEDPTIQNTHIDNADLAYSYRLTDNYNANLWTPLIRY